MENDVHILAVIFLLISPHILDVFCARRITKYLFQLFVALKSNKVKKDLIKTYTQNQISECIDVYEEKFQTLLQHEQSSIFAYIEL